MRSRVAFVAVLVVLLASPHGAQAICGSLPPVPSWPSPGAVAPRNARIALTIPSQLRAATELTLRTAPVRGKERATVPVTERTSRGSTTEHVELVPTAMLAPRTAYEIWTARGEILGAFTTNDATDTIAPSWGGLKRGTAWHDQPPPKAGGVITLPEECGSPLVWLEMDRYATDDQTAPKDLRYALWAVDAKRSIDYATPPIGWLTISPELQDRTRRAGATPTYVLSYGNTQEELNTITVPSMRPLKVGVRAIDLAGNASASSELTLK